MVPRVCCTNELVVSSHIGLGACICVTEGSVKRVLCQVKTLLETLTVLRLLHTIEKFIKPSKSDTIV